MDFVASLQEHFGFSEFRAGQREVIESLVAGRSAMAVFPTGSGKSLCYQLPAIGFDGLTLVVSPLIALMKDQLDFLQRKGVAAARLDSSLSLEEYRRVWQEISAGTLKLLYVAPERFGNERFMAQLSRVKISMLVVDEAHCMSEWGHNFRPDYMKLARIARELRAERALALTATATPSVAADVCRQFGIADADYVNVGFYRPNLELKLTPMAGNERDDGLLRRLREAPAGPAIVYVTLQKTAEAVAARLADAGLPARPYHAGLKPDLRGEVQDWFMASDDGIVVATIAFGMGIDKANIRYVYHYNQPKSLENYAQEIGRAGRDGKPAVCEVLYDATDRVTLENFAYGDTPEPQAVAAMVTELLGGGDRFDVSTYELSGRYDVRPLVVNTVLCYLELDEVIRATGPFYDEYQFKPQLSSAQILGQYEGDRREFLANLFRLAKPGRVWFKLQVSDCAKALGCERKRIVTALNYLEEQGFLTLKVAGLRLGFSRIDAAAEPAVVAAKLNERFVAAEKRELQRLAQVGDLVAAESCGVRKLLGYFGEELGRDCGHCDRCAGTRPAMVANKVAVMPDQLTTMVGAVRSWRHDAVATPRQVAKFLCGISSPATSRCRPPLSRRPEFGNLAEVPFGEVLAACRN